MDMLVEVEYNFLDEADSSPRVFYEQVNGEYVEKAPSRIDFPTQLYYRPLVGEYVLSADGKFSVKIVSITHKVKPHNRKTVLLLSVQ